MSIPCRVHKEKEFIPRSVPLCILSIRNGTNALPTQKKIRRYATMDWMWKTV
jgi:hypothetical protein